MAIKQETVELIKEKAAQGMSIKNIALECHVSEVTVRKKLKDGGMTKIRRVKPPNSRIIEMARLYQYEGKTYQEIGEMYNITRERVRQLLKRYGYLDQGRINPKPDLNRIQYESIIRQKLIEGKTWKVTAQELGISYGCLSSWIQKWNFPKKGLTKEELKRQNEEIKEKNLQGMRPKEIASEFNLTRGSIYRILQKQGIHQIKTPRRRYFNDDELAQLENTLIQKIIEGKTLKDIRQEMNFGKVSLKYWLKKLGLLDMYVRYQDSKEHQLNTLVRQLYTEGKTRAEIRQVTGLTEGSLAHRILKMDLPRKLRRKKK